ncbi:MAG: transposase [Myxococcales bacterium]|nr:MAG: transposase [Myxococcales bacterium]
MAYREVTMLEIREILRQWLAGVATKRIAARLGCDPKTVRRYIGAAQAAGLHPIQGGPELLTEAMLAEVVAGARSCSGAPRGEAWALCEQHRRFIEDKLGARVRLSKVRRLLLRTGVEIAYPTLHRFATAELGFGRRSPTVPVADGEPGKEIQVDVGWVVTLEPDGSGRRRRMRAWIFTPVLSRHRFVYPCQRETTTSAIEACEEAWEFYGGVFEVLIPDNTKTIVTRADALSPVFNEAFLEYSQARGFYIDPARVRSPKDKGRVERSVRDTRDDCFGGEVIYTLEQARERALVWSREEYGLRRHSTTGRMPKEHFESEEQPRLLPAPSEPYDIPTWHEPKIGRDHLAAVAKALYSLPTVYCGKRLRARADSQTVRFYDKQGALVKVHPRMAPGQRSIDAGDFPEHKAPYAMRDVEFLRGEAGKHGQSIGEYARQLLAGPLPWTRMRRVYALLGLVKKYGGQRVEQTCAVALAADMVDVTRLRRMLEQASMPAEPDGPDRPRRAQVIPISRYLREPSQYALPIGGSPDPHGGNTK